MVEMPDDFEQEFAELDLTKGKYVPSPEEIWEHFDKNEDGQINWREFKKAIKGLAKHFEQKLPKGWKKHARAAFNHTDRNNNSKIFHLAKIKAIQVIVNK